MNFVLLSLSLRALVLRETSNKLPCVNSPIERPNRSLGGTNNLESAANQRVGDLAHPVAP